MFVECNPDHSSNQRDKRVPIFDPYNILAAFDVGHRVLVSISTGLVSAFVVTGAWVENRANGRVAEAAL